MMNLGRAGLLTGVVLCVFSLWAEVPYLVVPAETVQRRLNLFKGNDTAREGAIVRLFAEPGCICTISVHSLTPQTLHVLHRSDDNPRAVRFHDYYDTYQLLAAYLAALDTMPIEDGHSRKIKPL